MQAMSKTGGLKFFIAVILSSVFEHDLKGRNQRSIPFIIQLI